MKNQKGQILLILLMTMLVGLAVGLVVTQKSITDVTTSTQTEQSSRAFSAAEAGIEKAISDTGIVGTGNIDITETDLGNQASAKVNVNKEIPAADQALEYPKISKETIAQFWLANPTSNSMPPDSYFTRSSFDVYFGNEDHGDDLENLPAIAVNVITFNGSSFVSNRYFYDSNFDRTSRNNFNQASCGSFTKTTANINGVSESRFSCKVSVPPPGCVAYTSPPPTTPPRCYTYISRGTPVLARVRLIYSSNKQKIALDPKGGPGGSLPPQAEVYESVGESGLSRKTIKHFRVKYVVPPFFDFALFSLGDISK